MFFSKFLNLKGLIATLCVITLSQCSWQASSLASQYSWVQLAQDRFVARVAIEQVGAQCPSVSVDGVAVAMTPRNIDAYQAEFPITLCQYSGSRTAKEVKFADGSLVKLSTSGTVGITGDTGCYVYNFEGQQLIQNCNDPEKYQGKAVADSLLAQNTDIVIHLGDYLYSKIPCPAGHEAECGGREYGDTWGGVKADFFSNWQHLLAKKPVILLRGNHERYTRGEKLWFTLFSLEDDSAAVAHTSHDLEPVYYVDFDKFRFHVMDSAEVYSKVHKSMEAYKAQMDTVDKNVNHSLYNIALTHKPMMHSNGKPDQVEHSECDRHSAHGQIVSSMQTDSAIDKMLSSGISLIMSGHVHYAMYYEIDSMYRQVVLGNGGAAPHDDMVADTASHETKPSVCKIHGHVVDLKYVSKDGQYGYGVMHAKDAGAHLDYYDSKKNVLYSVDIKK